MGTSRSNLHWDDTDYTAPTKAKTTAVEERHVETVCPSSNFLQDAEVMVGQTRRESTLACLGLSGIMAVPVKNRDLLLVRVLDIQVSHTVQQVLELSGDILLQS